MEQKPVVTVEDMTSVTFELRRPGCEKGVIHVEDMVQTAIFRVAPGSGVPNHHHSLVYDLFVGVKGLLEIRYEGEHGYGIFELKSGGFCAIPPGVIHEIVNSGDEEAFFLCIHAPYKGYDFIPTNFHQLTPALQNQEYTASQHSVGFNHK